MWYVFLFNILKMYIFFFEILNIFKLKYGLLEYLFYLKLRNFKDYVKLIKLFIFYEINKCR